MENPMKRKSKKKYIALGLLFLIGLSILLYPLISNQWNSYRDRKLINQYDQTVADTTDDEKIEEMLSAARAYNEEIDEESMPDAFSVRDGVTDAEYKSLLNVEADGMMGYVEIPVIGQTIPIYHYTTEESLQKGAGHLFGSSLPIGGENTHAVISAHRGLPSAKLFTDLNLVQEGDVFYIHILKETLAYEVDQILTVEPEETDSLAISKGEDLVTLVTCTPYAVNTQRLLVRGHRIDYDEAKNLESNETPVSGINNPSLVMLGLCVLIGIAIAFAVVTFSSKIKKR
jgi:sortase A